MYSTVLDGSSNIRVNVFPQSRFDSGESTIFQIKSKVFCNRTFISRHKCNGAELTRVHELRGR
jgi:hypothetical protein